MRLRSLSLAVVLSTCSVIVAFAASAATPTPSVTVTPTPLPNDIVLEASFVSGNGQEIWICLASQPDVVINHILVKNEPDDGCKLDQLDLGLQSGPDVARRHLVRFAAPSLTCDNGPHDWHFTYVDADTCSGCIKAFAAELAADDPFGFGCSSGGAFPIRAILNSYIAIPQTTGKLRFKVGTEQSFASVKIETLRIYDATDDFVTECPVSATISGGGTGLIDSACTPNAAAVLIPGTEYYTMISGKADGSDYIGYMPFPFGTAPAP